MKTDGNELVTMASSMVTVGNSFKRQGLYKFIRKMSFTRWKKEQLVLDLYNQGKTAKEIAKTVHMSFRDIGTIIHEQEHKQEIKEVQAQQQYSSSQA